MIVGIIPARYASMRFPGKPLVDLNGQTMLERVWNAATRSPMLDRVFIATDDERIHVEAQRIGAEAYLTSQELTSGTDRCDALLRQLRLKPDVIVNIQGDEPLLPPGVITHLVQTLKSAEADVATPVTRILFPSELDDADIVKAVRTDDGRIIYFSRSAVPFVRDVARIKWPSAHAFWKHIGIYAYTFDALRKHVMLPPSPLERIESLEQMRLLESGARFVGVETEAVFMSVDTPEDARRVSDYLRRTE